MFNIIVCIKQVPMVSQLPWDSKTGTLRRELAQGMMDPASRRALEAALQLKEEYRDVSICTITMGPPMAEEVLHQARALGADEVVLLTDRRMAGADTLLTSHILSEFIRQMDGKFDLILCGSQTSDSETAQVGPQLAEELDIPAVGYANCIKIKDNTAEIQRHADDFHEVLAMKLPGLVSVDFSAYTPRYLALEGVEQAFKNPDIMVIDAEKLGLDKNFHALKDSPTKIIDVYSPSIKKDNIILKGAVKKIVNQLFDEFGEIISSAIGKDLKTHEHDDILQDDIRNKDGVKYE